MKKLYPFLFALATPLILLLMSYSSGSPGGRTGSPGDGGNTCTQCHGGTATNMMGWITSNVPSSGYVPGQTYTFTATGTHSGVQLFGFELTVETANGTKIGTLIITDPDRTQLANGGDAVTHTSGGTGPSGNSNSWSVDWTAPATAQGQIGIYAAFNAANGNGNTSGDVIYKSSLFINPFSPPPTLVSISPDEAEQGDNFLATITGSNTTFSGSPSVSLSFSGNPLEVINASNVNVISATVIQAQFLIPGSSSTGLWDVHVNTLVLEDGFTVLPAAPAILFMDPNFAHQGDAFKGAINGENTSWTGSPSVYLSLVTNPAVTIVGANVVVVSNTLVTADFDIPSGAATGNYNVHVDNLVQNAGFTVLQALVPALSSIVPSSAEQGSLVNTTITAENTQFSGTTPAVSLSLHSNPAEVINATSVIVVNNTTLQAAFDIPFEATPGQWDLNVDDLVLENSFEVIDVVPFLVGIAPDAGMQGETLNTVITAADSRFTIEDPLIWLTFSGNPLEIIEASGITVLTDETVQATFVIPADASVGTWDLHVDEMLLEDAFTVEMFIGINALVLETVKIYPNPATEKFFVGNAAGAVVSVLNLRGEVLISQAVESPRQQIGISALSKGIYMVRITSGNNTRVEKLLVN